MVESDKKVTISITDEGPGILDADQKRLFGGYKKMVGEDGADKSAGIGLAIVYRLLEKLNGKIEVKSAIGRGATFIVKLNK